MPSSLTGTELEVMRILWQYGELKPAEIQSRYARPIKNAALRFQLRVLLEKGHVVRRKVGKAYYYKAATRRGGTLKSMVRHLADIYCGGSTVGLIAELIRTEKLTSDDIEELNQITGRPADKRDTKQKGGKKQ